VLVLFRDQPFAPSYHLTSLGIRRSASDGASDAAWCWRPASGGSVDLEVFDRGVAGSMLNPRASLVSRRDPRRDPLTARPLFGSLSDPAWCAAYAFALLLGLGLVWALARLLFHLDADTDQPDRLDDGPGWPSRRRIFCFETPLRPWMTRRPVACCPSIDLRDPTSPEILRCIARGRMAPAGSCVEVDHAEAVVGDAEREPDVLGALAALRAAGTLVRILSDVDPIAFLAAGSADATSASAATEDGEKKEKAERAYEEAARRSASLRAWSAALADMSRWLVTVAGDVASRYAEPRDGDLDRLDRLHARNSRIWSACSPSEKLALRQLASEGLLSPADGEVARSLVERGLLRRAPAFELLDDSFRWFVLRAVPPEALERWESAAGPSAWSRLRVPLAALLALGAIVIVVTQRETFYTAIGIVGAVGAVLPRLIDFFGRLGNQRATPA
jgi:hypothetical protein